MMGEKQMKICRTKRNRVSSEHLWRLEKVCRSLPNRRRRRRRQCSTSSKQSSAIISHYDVNSRDVLNYDFTNKYTQND